MIKAITDLYSTDPQGFWLNVLSNVPFLFFDVLFIVIFLPLALEAVRKFSMRKARKIALEVALRDLDRVFFSLAVAVAGRVPNPFATPRDTTRAAARIAEVVDNFQTRFSLNMTTHSSCLEGNDLAKLIEAKHVIDEYIEALSFSLGFLFNKSEYSSDDEHHRQLRAKGDALAKWSAAFPRQRAQFLMSEPAYRSKLMLIEKLFADATDEVLGRKSLKPMKRRNENPVI